ncbi:hypothetical protein [Mongoliimonas terrestris]|uniref:hypothetical protein n=1 Tax=Mongoliimonas terrestris TaxID=1709001 RepID=UPI000949B0AE|nr:hypothetical protein [Mongoliimonas terrestris]
MDSTSEIAAHQRLLDGLAIEAAFVRIVTLRGGHAWPSTYHDHSRPRPRPVPGDGAPLLWTPSGFEAAPDMLVSHPSLTAVSPVEIRSKDSFRVDGEFVFGLDASKLRSLEAAAAFGPPLIIFRDARILPLPRQQDGNVDVEELMAIDASTDFAAWRGVSLLQAMAAGRWLESAKGRWFVVPKRATSRLEAIIPWADPLADF